MFVNYYNKGSQATQVGSHGIEASYITVHSYDILVINTRPLPWTCAITKISYSYCDITNTRSQLLVSVIISQFHGKQHTINKTTLTTDGILSVDNTLHTILTVHTSVNCYTFK